MKKRKTKNPLTRRIPRELIGDWPKYLVVGLFLILTIGAVSGMYVANGSMMKAADESVDDMMKGGSKAKTKAKAAPAVEAPADSEDDIDTMF